MNVKKVVFRKLHLMLNCNYFYVYSTKINGVCTNVTDYCIHIYFSSKISVFCSNDHIIYIATKNITFNFNRSNHNYTTFTTVYSLTGAGVEETQMQPFFREGQVWRQFYALHLS